MANHGRIEYWPDPDKAPLLAVPAHLEWTIPALRVLSERSDLGEASRETVNAALSALTWMKDQLTTVIDAAEQINQCAHMIRVSR